MRTNFFPRYYLDVEILIISSDFVVQLRVITIILYVWLIFFFLISWTNSFFTIPSRYEDNKDRNNSACIVTQVDAYNEEITNNFAKLTDFCGHEKLITFSERGCCSNRQVQSLWKHNRIVIVTSAFGRRAFAGISLVHYERCLSSAAVMNERYLHIEEWGKARPRWKRERWYMTSINHPGYRMRPWYASVPTT